MSTLAVPPAVADRPVRRITRHLRTVRADVFQVTEKIYLPEHVLPRHAHQRANVTFFLSGAMVESAGAAREVARAGSWVTKPADVEHANRVGRHGARVLEVVFEDGTAIPGLGYAWRHGGPEAVTFLRIYRELRLGDANAALIISGLLHELLAGGDEATGTGPAWVGEVRDRLHDAGARTPSLRELARAFDVHPTYLARAFRRRYGCSIGDYARRLRVERAARRLARRSPQGLSGIALDEGFADQSHLTRTFRAHTGMTPGTYREFIRSD